jgi:hypothetical protein
MLSLLLSFKDYPYPWLQALTLNIILKPCYPIPEPLRLDIKFNLKQPYTLSIELSHKPNL